MVNGLAMGTRVAATTGVRAVVVTLTCLSLLALGGCGGDEGANGPRTRLALPASLAIKPSVAAGLSTTASAIRSSRVLHSNLTAASALELVKKRFPKASSAPVTLAQRPDVKVRRYVGRHAAVVTVNGKRALVRSSEALTVPMGGKERPVDPTLEVRGRDLVPSVTASRYRLTRVSGRGAQLRFPGAGFGIDATLGDVRRKAMVSDGAAFYANTQHDTDVIVQPQTTGAELSWQLRSSAAPQALQMAFSGLDRLRAVASKHASPGGFELLRAGRRVGTMRTPSAVDAAGRTVKLTTLVHGSALRIGVVHRGRGYQYPILVDPFVLDDQRYWLTQSVTDYTGWQQRVNNVGFIPIQTSPAQPGGFGHGLNVVMAGNRPYVSGNYGEWYYTAPYVPGQFESEGARIFQADFGYTAHLPTRRNDNANMSCISEGINNRAAGTYPTNGIYRGSQITDTPAPYGIIPGYGYLNCAAMGTAGFASTYGYLVHCFLAPCDPSTPANQAQGTPGNQAIFGMVSIGGNAISNGAVYMGSSLIFETETAKPHTSMSGLPADWVDNAQATVTSTDYGLGVATITANAPGWSGARFDGSCIRTGLNPSSGVPNPNPAVPQTGNKGDRNNRCRNTETLGFNTSTLPEGASDVTIAGIDTVGNTDPTPARVKIDRSAPVITPAGTLYDAQNAFVGANQDYALSVTASDGALAPDAARRSGVTSLTATLDGQSLSGGSASAPCTRPEGSCSLAINASLSGDQVAELDDAASHTVRIQATDALGHTKTDTFTFRVDLTDPSLTALDGALGDLADLDPRPLRENDYDLIAEARDNFAENNESGDLDGDPAPPPVPPGSGILNIVIRLDGQSVTSVTTDCAPGAECDKRQTWEWNAAAAVNGAHEIKVAVADRVGNQSETTWQVDLQHVPDEPSRTLSSVRRTLAGAAANDQAGSSVAAVGDVNGDGRADYLVGALGASEGGRNAAGAAYLVLGEPGDSTVDLATRPSSVKRILGPASNSYCGASVAGAGDINGDGRSDLLVGCPGLNPASGSLTPTTGRVYVVYGRATPQDLDLATLGSDGMAIVGPADNAGLSLPLGTARPAVFGERLQGAPIDAAGGQDVNSDGYADLVIGDSAVPSGGLTSSGAAYVVYGKPSPASVNVSNLAGNGYVIRGDRQYGLAGYAATIAGDLDGDLLAEVVIGSPGARTTDGGRAYVVGGSTSTADVDLGSSTRARTISSPEAGDRFGAGIVGLGDTNLDAHDDIAIATNSGAYVLRTIPDTNRPVAPQDGYRVTGPVNSPGLLGGLLPGLTATVPATSISSAGDLDGDERADMSIGYPDAPGARAYTIFSPERPRSLNVAALPGQRGAAVASGTQSDRSGASTGANAYQIDSALTENAQIIVGAPLATPTLFKAQAGRAYILGERTPTGPGAVLTPPEDPTQGVESEPPAARAQAVLPGKYKVDGNGPGGYATVRAAAQSLVVGNAADRQTAFAVNTIGRKSVYYLALFKGNLNFCGWIGAGKLVTPGTPASGFTCSAKPYKYKNFMGVVSCEECNDGPEIALRAGVNANGVAVDRLGQPMPAGGTIPYYRNVLPLKGAKARPSPKAPTGTLPLGTVAAPTRVKWRYLTKGGKFAMIKVPRTLNLLGSDWVFIDAKYIPFPIRGGLCGNPTGPTPIPPTRKDWPYQCQERNYQIIPPN